MNLKNIIITVIALFVIAIGGFAVYFFLAAGSGEASQDISEVAPTLADSEEGTRFRIVPAESQASFTLDEDLAGVRTTVVGTTDQVGGDLVINFDDPAQSEVGQITINARTLQTDNDFRNSALRANVLRSARDEYEFITFEPTELVGLPESVEVGETYDFQIVGDLTIIETTNPVTFDASVTITSESEISGSASALITYGDWDIPIPTAPRVANVDEQTTLAFEFVARTTEE
ncbi:MAG: YceI family protein [Anaerolineae bacterium]